MLTADDRQEIERIVERVVQASEERVVARINHEVTDLAEINREALNRLDNHESRIQNLETTAAHA